MTSTPKVEQYGDRAVSGFMWFFSQTVLVRLVNYASQIILAWILAPNAFGLIGIAYSIQIFAAILQNNGLSQILIAKREKFDEYVNPSFWLSAVFGFVTLLIMVLVGPIAAEFYNNQKLTGLIYILAISAFFNAFKPVMVAKLSLDLDFKKISIIQGIELISQKILTVIFALIGFGVYSFVIPSALVTPVVLLYLFFIVKPKLKLTPDFNKWSTLIWYSIILLSSGIFYRIIQYGDYLILGKFYTENQVGIYFMAYTLSVQPIMLIANNIRELLVPVVSRLNKQNARQESAFLRTTRIILIISFLLSGYLIVNAEAIIKLFLNDTWNKAIPILQLLAFGMAIRPLMISSEAFLEGNGRFNLKLYSATFTMILFLITTLTFGRISIELFSISIGFVFIFGSVLIYFYAKGFTFFSLKILIKMLYLPLLSSAIAVTLNILLAHYIPKNDFWYIFQIIVSGFVFLIVTFLIIQWLNKDMISDFKKIYNYFVDRQRYQTSKSF